MKRSLGRFMRKILATFFIVLAAAIIGGIVATSPWVMEAGIRLTCRGPSDRCLVRMRSMGHVWSRWDYLGRARRWYARGAEHGDRVAMFHLGWVYEEEGIRDVRTYLRGKYGTPGVFEVAVGTLREFLAPRSGGELPGKPEPKLSLERNEQALVWYRRAAELGFAPAMNNLGQLYLNGSLGRRDEAEAFRWHLAAAEAGNFIGAMNVGFAFRSGHGVAPDPSAAEKWSSWIATGAGRRDLLEPTFGRTFLYGRNALLPIYRQQIRIAAERSEPVTMSVGSLTPNDKLPTFRSVQQGLKK